ncbi:hypothetical protein SARC_04149 [Sphaeroforma arctica JP610]|uniref:Uncharacterized protein n=1 Tax=Sphaeroforma arctica JP610 TaxID=667725 RepID=A0A0L0G432_9EUKA|nr:hypothetical protein SARC_04149 [Sphaeroforma arctica JP610]KNC83614.1 hypothetical protein SARC_04149 [Sphaeroforma arctica JP610]|eukprot:XP_014157516.1 hypothetical protein SARC_04149 [Sphaeroforma arctica JP610]
MRPKNKLNGFLCTTNITSFTDRLPIPLKAWGVVRNRFTGESKGHTGYQRSGDATVPYVSLSWANLWHHNTSKIEQQTVAARVIEFYDHPIGKWGERTVFSLMNVNEPEYQIYYSKHKNGDDGDIHFTSVYEIKGGECQHRNIVKDPFIHKLIGQTLLDDLKMDYETPNLEDDTKAANRKISDMRLRHDADGMDDDMGMSLEE